MTTASKEDIQWLSFEWRRPADYTVMANHHLKNKALSLKAKGLLSIMLSLPETWNYTTRGLAAICREGVDSISSALRELEKAGYVVRYRLRDERGRITDTEYVIYETPRAGTLPDTPSPDTENPDMDTPGMESEDVEGTATARAGCGITRYGKPVYGRTVCGQTASGATPYNISRIQKTQINPKHIQKIRIHPIRIHTAARLCRTCAYRCEKTSATIAW